MLQTGGDETLSLPNESRVEKCKLLSSRSLNQKQDFSYIFFFISLFIPDNFEKAKHICYIQLIPSSACLKETTAEKEK